MKYTLQSGQVVEVDYTFKYGSPTTYSPMTGAHGGDPDEVTIIGIYNEAGTEDVVVSDNEREKIEEAILEIPHDYDYHEDDVI